MSKRRVFVPASTVTPTSVARWEWTRAKGLWVVYCDGLRLKSDWGTLPEFLRAVAEGREVRVTEEKG